MFLIFSDTQTALKTQDISKIIVAIVKQICLSNFTDKACVNTYLGNSHRWRPLYGFPHATSFE